MPSPAAPTDPNSPLRLARERLLAGNLPPADNITCVCGAPRLEHAGKAHAGGFAWAECTRYRADRIIALAVQAATASTSDFRDDLKAAGAKRRARRGRRAPGTVSVRPSDAGACRRKVWYRERPPEDFEPSPTNPGPGFIGGLIHDALLEVRRRLYPWRMYGDRKGMEVLWPGMDTAGQYDEYDPITGELRDVKTAGEWKWSMVGENGADEDWWDQMSLYGFALVLLGWPVTTLIAEVIQRADGKTELFRVPYSEQRALEVLARHQALATMIELDIVPPRDRSGPTTDGLCRNCFAREHCWDMPRAERMRRTPESLTILGVMPEDAAVEELAAALVAKRAERTTAEKAEAELKALLGGVRLKAYGEYEPVPGHKPTKDWQGWYDRVLSMWSLPDDQRPEHPGEPATRKTEYVTWKPLRKATRIAMEKAEKERPAREAAELEEKLADAEAEGWPTAVA